MDPGLVSMVLGWLPGIGRIGGTRAFKRAGIGVVDLRGVLVGIQGAAKGVGPAHLHMGCSEAGSQKKTDERVHHFDGVAVGCLRVLLELLCSFVVDFDFRQPSRRLLYLCSLIAICQQCLLMD